MLLVAAGLKQPPFHSIARKHTLGRGREVNHSLLQTPCAFPRQALAYEGPVVVILALNLNDSTFEFYESGVYNGRCSDRYTHAMLLTGMDESTWTLRNSWGAIWGEGGYVRVPRGENYCGIGNQSFYPGEQIRVICM